MAVERADQGRVTVLRIDHGPVNAMDLELMQELHRTIAGVAAHRAVVLTGNGRVFSAGVDLKRAVSGGPAYLAEFLPVFSDALVAVLTHPGPVVAAVDGHAVAGGAILALACDYRIMAAGRFGVPELAVGVPFPTVPLEILRHASGGAFRPAIIRRDTLTVEAAVRAGLVDEAVAPDELLAAAVGQADALAAIPGPAFRLTKQAMQAPMLERIAHDRPRRDPEAFAAWQSDEVLGAVAAYLETLAAARR